MANFQTKRTLRNDLAFDIPALAPFVRRNLSAKDMSVIWELAAGGIGEGVELVDMKSYPLCGGWDDIEFTIQPKECAIA